MNKVKFVKEVSRKLKCSGQKRKDIKEELESNIDSALEQGEQWEDLMKRMGSPSIIANEFNENFPEKEKAAAKKTKVIKIALIVIVALGIVVGFVSWMVPKTTPLSSSAVFNEENVISETKTIIELLDEGDFDAVTEKSNEKIKAAIDKKTLTEVKQQLGENWGDLETFSSIYTYQITQTGKQYAVVQIVGEYENISVTYTISFDESMQLAGIYMKK